MTIKTAEQIANDLYWSGEFTTPLDGKGAEIRRVMAQAIEADRAQREFPMSDPLIELREWASTVSQYMAEDKSNDWSEEIAQLEVIEERLDNEMKEKDA